MENKRVTAMSFDEEDEEFFANAKNPNVDQKSQNPVSAQTSTTATNQTSQLTGDPAKNQLQPEKQQDSKPAPTSHAGNESKSSAKLAASTSQAPKLKNRQVPESPQTPQASPNPPKADKAAKISVSTNSATPEAQKSEKKKRVRKTKAERLQLLKERLNKKIAGAAQMQKEVEILEQKIAWAEKSPEEQREYTRALDTHCKVLAGAIAINLFNDKNAKFDRETFQKIIFDSLSRPEDIIYFEKKLHD